MPDQFHRVSHWSPHCRDLILRFLHSLQVPTYVSIRITCFFVRLRMLIISKFAYNINRHQEECHKDHHLVVLSGTALIYPNKRHLFISQLTILFLQVCTIVINLVHIHELYSCCTKVTRLLVCMHLTFKLFK